MEYNRFKRVMDSFELLCRIYNIKCYSVTATDFLVKFTVFRDEDIIAKAKEITYSLDHAFKFDSLKFEVMAEVEKPVIIVGRDLVV